MDIFYRQKGVHDVDAIHFNQLVQHHYRDQDETGIVTCYCRDGSILRSAKYVLSMIAFLRVSARYIPKIDEMI